MVCAKLREYYVELGEQVLAAGSLDKLDLFSSQEDFLDSRKVTIAYSGLQLYKAATSRNFILSLYGQRFGINFLRRMRHQNDAAAEMLTSVKNSVFVAKDIQYEYLMTYMTCSTTVRQALEVKTWYNVIRSPERIMTYTENGKKEKRIIL